ncbi:MAG: M28 family peptidase [Calditrichaeota bacterium]|nr:M28 family peptidase [Calditrichota bacterium]
MAKKRPAKKKPTKTSTPQVTKVKPLPYRAFIGAALILVLAAIVYWLIFKPFASPQFDGENAFEQLVKQCDFGSRVPGSEGHRTCGDFLLAELRRYSDRVSEQTFTYTDKKDSSRVYRGRNMIASFNLQPEKGYRVMLCAHWDSRPFADKDPDSSRHADPVPGANDGASGTAVLLEMARVLDAFPPEIGVDIVLFDLEDLGDYGAEDHPDSLNPFSIGAAYFAAHREQYTPRYGILLDMIGDQDLRIKKEAYSQAAAPLLMDQIWAAAKTAGATAFIDSTGVAITDDHVPFLRQGIPVVNLIDFDYPYWHTVADTPDKCSPASLQQVGDVLVEMIYR